MQSSIFLCLAATALVVSAQTTSPPPLPDCSSITTSPQWAILCRLAQGVDTPVLQLGGLTANFACDQDCRCIMGATARGGKCGMPQGQSEAYCMCDYGAEPAIQPLWQGPLCTGLSFLTNLCDSSIVGPSLNDLCNKDCQCSHGYGNTGNHICTNNNGLNSTRPYCVCGGATTLAKASS